MRMFIALLLLIAAICFGLGISLPIVHFQKLYFFNDTPSIISLFYGLWMKGNWLVAIAILIFSIIFPLVKLLITFISAISPTTQFSHSPIIKWAGVLSKWSMMDVLLVALVIFAAKSSGLAEAFAQPGLWFYATSAICGAIAAGLIKKAAATSTTGRESQPVRTIL
ncbi:MAG: paraquat-inducible protein A [Rhizobiaceae bacterium]